MSTIYFLKINLATTNMIDYISRSEKNKKQIEKHIINQFIKYYDKNDVEYIKVRHIPGDEESENDIEAVYTVNGVKDISYRRDNTLYGIIRKTSKLFIKDEDNEGKIFTKAVPYIEAIRFVYDVKNEIVAFHTAARFGYKEFEEVFTNLHNILLEKINHKDLEISVECSIKRKGLSLDQIKEELKKMGKIDELNIRIRTPNPNEKALESLRKNAEKFHEEIKAGNIDQIESKYKSKDKRGINIDSDIIEKEFDLAESINSKIKLEESISNDYIEINGKNKSGDYFSTKDSTPLKHEIDENLNEDTFIKKIVKVISMFL